MTDCRERYEELTHPVQRVLDEDLAALQRQDERTRIQRYNDLKANEQTFLDEFTRECADFLTGQEKDRVRARFRLARLLIAASFYADDADSLPRALADEFIEAELQAVADFDRFKQFDALSESQIEEKIRRMDGEVYELVTEYTSTQLANVDELIENPDVQQDVIEQLLARYEDRREKIRQGFFIYVETHGLEHMVESIEQAVRAVNEAAGERERIREQLREDHQDLSETVGQGFTRKYRRLETQMQRVQGTLASRDVDPATVEDGLKGLEKQRSELADSQESALTELDGKIERTTEMDAHLEAQIGNLERAKESATEDATRKAHEEAAELVEEELEQLREQRSELAAERTRLERERERIESARDRLDEKQQTLEERVSTVEQSLDTDEAGIGGEDVVTAQMARVMEMDYLGRFDISMHEAESIHTSDGPFEIPEGYWGSRSERRSERARLIDLLDGETPDQYPTNGSARYEVTSGRYLGLTSTTEMVVEARVLSNLEAFAANGFDASPAGLDELLDIVNEAVEEAERGEFDYLLAVASPTGWTDRVREQIQADVSRTRFSQYLSVCLVDLQDGSVVYDDTDPIASANATLFEPPIDAERIQDCVETVRREYVEDIMHETVLLQDVVDEHGFDDDVVKRAFNDLEEQGKGEQLYVDDLGLSLECGTY